MEATELAQAHARRVGLAWIAGVPETRPTMERTRRARRRVSPAARFGDEKSSSEPEPARQGLCCASRVAAPPPRVTSANDQGIVREPAQFQGERLGLDRCPAGRRRPFRNPTSAKSPGGEQVDGRWRVDRNRGGRAPSRRDDLQRRALLSRPRCGTPLGTSAPARAAGASSKTNSPRSPTMWQQDAQGLVLVDLCEVQHAVVDVTVGDRAGQWAPAGRFGRCRCRGNWKLACAARGSLCWRGCARAARRRS